MSQQPDDTFEPHVGIDVHDNDEARASEGDQTSSVARASGGGAPPRDAVPAGEDQPDAAGTAAGDQLAGITISKADAADAVSGDTGPEHPGTRRSS